MNTTTVVGNVTRDPELRFSPSGAPTCSFGLAFNRRWKDGDEWQEAVSFFDIVCWRDLAENVAASLHKGTRVVVTGRLEQRSWENSDGESRSKVEIVADEIARLVQLAPPLLGASHVHHHSPGVGLRERAAGPLGAERLKGAGMEHEFKVGDRVRTRRFHDDVREVLGTFTYRTGRKGIVVPIDDECAVATPADRWEPAPPTLAELDREVAEGAHEHLKGCIGGPAWEQLSTALKARRAYLHDHPDEGHVSLFPLLALGLISAEFWIGTLAHGWLSVAVIAAGVFTLFLAWGLGSEHKSGEGAGRSATAATLSPRVARPLPSHVGPVHGLFDWEKEGVA